MVKKKLKLKHKKKNHTNQYKKKTSTFLHERIYKAIN